MSFHPELTLGGTDLYRLAVGGLLFWFPGITWTWALTPRLAWAYRIPLSILAAFTVQPAAMMLLNLVLQVPVNLATTSFLSAVTGLIGLMLLLRNAKTLLDPEPTSASGPAPATSPPHGPSPPPAPTRDDPR